MKTMTCKQLGGACDKAFSASTFEEIGKMSQKHGVEMLEQHDVEHMKAMDEMKKLMMNPEDMKEWFEGKKKEFEELADD
tara:strand:+ start:1147 stop:1383 length:237 start_codon:yes stop_codon:yes gene_type:complete